MNRFSDSIKKEKDIKIIAYICCQTKLRYYQWFNLNVKYHFFKIPEITKCIYMNLQWIWSLHESSSVESGNLTFPARQTNWLPPSIVEGTNL